LKLDDDVLDVEILLLIYL